MEWNWQQSDWGKFTYKSELLRPWEDQFLQTSGLWKGSFAYLPEEDQNVLRVELMSTEALQSSRIEGEMLDRESVQASIRRWLGLAVDRRKVGAAEAGIAELTVDVYRSFAEPLSHDRLFQWHQMLTNGRRDLQDIGRYRTHAEPMQIVSGPLIRPQIHFEAPPSEKVPSEMDAFLSWFNRSHPEGSDPLPAIARAGIAHLYFESIHPFEDGNGRIGRAIAEKALSQGIQQASLIMLADILDQNRKKYYDALGEASVSNDLSEWLSWFAEMVVLAQQRSVDQVEFVLCKTKFFDQFKGQLNQRQEKVIRRLFGAGPDGFMGGLSAQNYQRIAKTSAATATRDLQDLVQKNALTRSGERKHTRYRLAISGVWGEQAVSSGRKK